MGLSSTQVRLLQLTNRKNDIGLELSKLSNSKVALTRDMQKLSRDYNNKINQKTLKWSNNGGASYVDLSYQNLMRPSTMNLNKPYFVTDQSGRIVVDNQYAKYAEMISPNGAPGGDWESVRSQVLADITGLDQTDIEADAAYLETLTVSKEKLNEIKNREPEMPIKDTGIGLFLDNISNVSNISDWSTAYYSAQKISISGSSDFKTLLDDIYTGMSEYVTDPENLKKAFDELYDECTGIIDNPESYSNPDAVISGTSGNLSVNIKSLIDGLIGYYSSKSSNVCIDSEGDTQITWVDINSNQYSKWKTEHDAWKIEYDNMLKDYQTAQENYNALFTTDERNLIKFYDEIFSTIAEKGWVCNNSITDTDYLNQMFQNNIYTITTVDRNLETDDSGSDCEWESDYYTTIASNCKNIFIVNDTDKQSDALVEFEYQKSLIEAKESRIDTRMKTLETEQSIVSQMMQSLEQVKNDNIERFMNVFG